MWRASGTCEEIFAILSDGEGFARWWPSVYLGADVIEPGAPDGTGRVVRLRSKGWLPYALTWTSRIASQTPPTHLVVTASGDFEGTGAWQLRPIDGGAEVTFDWNITVTPWFLRAGSSIFRPVFRANHEWAMARGGESLALELRRRRAKTSEERSSVPAPPGPVLWWTRR